MRDDRCQLDECGVLPPKWRKSGGSMATLNVKNLPDALYRKLKARAKRERRSVAQEVTVLLTEALEPAAPRSILELRGLGKEMWRGIDAVDHVASERRASHYQSGRRSV